jgi:hypothetical protein
MDLHLAFARGNMSGEGNDDIGRFLIKGRYDAASRECYWTKSYVGAHDVFYRGFREGKGIWGTWEVNIFGHGGFHIWPRHAGDGEADSESAVQAEPVDAIATEAVTPPAGAMKVEGCARCLPNSLVTVTGGIATLGDDFVCTHSLAGPGYYRLHLPRAEEPGVRISLNFG